MSGLELERNVAKCETPVCGEKQSHYSLPLLSFSLLLLQLLVNEFNVSDLFFVHYNSAS